MAIAVGSKILASDLAASGAKGASAAPKTSEIKGEEKKEGEEKK